MLNIQEVVNFLNEHLNTNENITFNVKAEVGESDKESLINGILRTANSKTTPIANYVENRYTFVVELSVPTARTNKVFLKAQDIVSGFVDDYDGTKVEFTNGNGTINCSLGKPETFKVAYNVGDCTPLYFTIDMVYTESGVMSIDKKWYLSADGTTFYEIPYETESVVVNKEGITRKVDFDKYTKTYLTGQTKFYKFKFPYQNTELGNMLMKDILNGDFKKQYTLKYVDGINYIDDDLTKPPFETKVSLYMSGDLNSQVVNVGKFDITFTDVDDGNTETKYYLGLIDWAFDLSGEDTRWFASQSAQQTYFEDLVTSGTGWQQIKAPNLNSIYITSQVFPNENNMNIFDLVRKNYAIIKVVKTEDGVTTTQYIYYGATNCQIGANGQVTYDLEEDTVQTFMFNTYLNLGDAFIERCHLNRYILNTNNNYYYNWKVDSALFEREEAQGLSKRTTNRQKLIPQYTSHAEVNAWLETNVLCWVCIWFNQDTFTKYEGASNPIKPDPLNYVSTGSVVSSHLRMLAYPLYKTANGLIKTTADNTLKYAKLNKAGVDEFLKLNNGYADVMSIKITKVMPMFKNTTISFPDTNTMLVTGTTNLSFTSYIVKAPGTPPIDDDGVMFLTKQNMNDYVTMSIENNFFTNEFTKAQAKSNTVEPKLYNEDYSIYHIYYGGQTYDLPISKSSNKPAFRYYEMLTPDITKFVLAFDSQNELTNNPYDTNSVFGTYSVKDFTGFVGTLDTSLWYATDNLDEYLAQNKNNLQIFQNQQDLEMRNARKSALTGLAGAGIGFMSSLATGSPLGVVGGLVSGVQGASSYLSTAWKQETDRINRDLTLDNMAQSPDKVSAINSNIILINALDELGFYIEVQETIPHEKQQIRDYLKRYGYTVNKLGKISDYLTATEGGATIFNRKYWIYIKAILSSISGVPMSMQERINLKQRFENGIRFWNSSSISYASNNYETYLDY